MRPSTPFPCGPSTDAWRSSRFPCCRAASARTFEPSARAKTTARAGGAGKTAGAGEVGGEAGGCVVVVAGAEGAAAASTGPGVCERSTATTTTAATPAARAATPAATRVRPPASTRRRVVSPGWPTRPGPGVRHLDMAVAPQTRIRSRQGRRGGVPHRTCPGVRHTTAFQQVRKGECERVTPGWPARPRPGVRHTDMAAAPQTRMRSRQGRRVVSRIGPVLVSDTRPLFSRAERGGCVTARRAGRPEPRTGLALRAGAVHRRRRP